MNAQIAVVGALRLAATSGVSTKSSSPFAAKSIGFGALSIWMDPFMRKLLKKSAKAPRVMITDKLKSYGAARICSIRDSTIEPRIRICRQGDVRGL